MKILVCLKQVPGPENRFSYRPTPPGYDALGVSFSMNTYDAYALEEALCIRDSFPDTSVTVLSLGPERVRTTILRGMEVGAGHGTHLLDSEAETRDAFEIASLIANWINGKRFDLILTGVMAEDSQRGQTGPLLASMLRLPYATPALTVKVAPEQTTILAERERESGRIETVTLPLPALVSMQSSRRTPRYPSLSNKLRARRLVIETRHPTPPPSSRRSAKLKSISLPPSADRLVCLSGSLEEKADALLDILQEKGLI